MQQQQIHTLKTQLDSTQQCLKDLEESSKRSLQQNLEINVDLVDANVLFLFCGLC
jgi:hypothetical protein